MYVFPVAALIVTSAFPSFVSQKWCRPNGRFSICRSSFATHHLPICGMPFSYMLLTTIAVHPFAVSSNAVGTIAVPHLLFHICRSSFAVPHLLLHLCCFTFAVPPLLFLICCPTFAVPHLPLSWKLSNIKQPTATCWSFEVEPWPGQKPSKFIELRKILGILGGTLIISWHAVQNLLF